MEESVVPAIKLKTNRAMWKFILFSLITFGIYGLVVMSHVSTEINYIASKHDHRNTLHYCLMFFCSHGLHVSFIHWFGGLNYVLA